MMACRRWCSRSHHICCFFMAFHEERKKETLFKYPHFFHPNINRSILILLSPAPFASALRVRLAIYYIYLFSCFFFLSSIYLYLSSLRSSSYSSFTFSKFNVPFGFLFFPSLSLLCRFILPLTNCFPLLFYSLYLNVQSLSDLRPRSQMSRP